MTKDEAIRILERGSWWDLIDPSGSDADLDPLDEAIEVVLDVLHSQQAPAKLDRSRWEGCAHCMTPRSRKARQNLGYSYCEHCGLPLTEEAWAELERRIGGNDGTAER